MDTAPENYTTKAGMQRSYTNSFIKRGVRNILPAEYIQAAGTNYGLTHHHSEHIFAILASNNLDKIKDRYKDAQQQNTARSINIHIHGDHSPSDLDMLALILLRNYIVENFPGTTVGLLFTYDNHYKAATHDPKTTSSIEEMREKFKDARLLMIEKSQAKAAAQRAAYDSRLAKETAVTKARIEHNNAAKQYLGLPFKAEKSIKVAQFSSGHNAELEDQVREMIKNALGIRLNQEISDEDVGCKIRSFVYRREIPSRCASNFSTVGAGNSSMVLRSVLGNREIVREDKLHTKNRGIPWQQELSRKYFYLLASPQPRLLMSEGAENVAFIDREDDKYRFWYEDQNIQRYLTRLLAEHHSVIGNNFTIDDEETFHVILAPADNMGTNQASSFPFILAGYVQANLDSLANKLLIPFNIDNQHWVSLEVNLQSRRFTIHDPLYRGNQVQAAHRDLIVSIMGTLNNCFAFAQGNNFSYQNGLETIARQKDGHSCGVIVLRDIRSLVLSGQVSDLSEDLTEYKERIKFWRDDDITNGIVTNEELPNDSNIALRMELRLKQVVENTEFNTAIEAIKGFDEMNQRAGKRSILKGLASCHRDANATEKQELQLLCDNIFVGVKLGVALTEAQQDQVRYQENGRSMIDRLKKYIDREAISISTGFGSFAEADQRGAEDEREAASSPERSGGRSTSQRPPTGGTPTRRGVVRRRVEPAGPAGFSERLAGEQQMQRGHGREF